MQAKNLGAYFKNIKVTQIFTSNILRAQLTAKEIGNVIQKEPIVLDGVGERKVEYLNASEYTFIETSDDFYWRIIATKQTFENLPEGRFIFVGHAIFLKSLLAYMILGDEVTEKVCDRMGDVLVVDNGTVSKCIYNHEKQKWRIGSLNEVVRLNFTN